MSGVPHIAIGALRAAKGTWLSPVSNCDIQYWPAIGFNTFASSMHVPCVSCVCKSGIMCISHVVSMCFACVSLVFHMRFLWFAYTTCVTIFYTRFHTFAHMHMRLLQVSPVCHAFSTLAMHEATLHFTRVRLAFHTCFLAFTHICIVLHVCAVCVSFVCTSCVVCVCFLCRSHVLLVSFTFMCASSVVHV